MPETEIVSCPACRHLVRIPADWLGQPVQCPECRAKFTAPARDGDRLTEAVLLAGPPDAPAQPPRRGRDLLLMLPAFGLMLLGFTGLVVNGWHTVQYAQNPAAAEDDAANVFANWKKEPRFGEKVDEEEERRHKEATDRAAGVVRVMMPGFAIVSALVCYGGLAILRGRHYRLAQLGCVLACLNFANGCCFPGAIVGIWGLLMLRSEEGRGHFGGASGTV